MKMHGVLKGDVCSAGWELIEATFNLTEKGTEQTLSLDLRIKVMIRTIEKSAPKQISKFDKILCEQSEGWKQLSYMKIQELFGRQGK